MQHAFSVMMLLLLTGAGVGVVAAEEPPPTVVLKPQMRIADRDWEYFSRLPCDSLFDEVPRSDTEKSLLERRKRACLDRYRAFSPQPGVR